MRPVRYINPSEESKSGLSVYNYELGNVFSINQINSKYYIDTNLQVANMTSINKTNLFISQAHYLDVPQF